MSLTKKTNPYDLTDDEIKFLKGSSVPPEVKTYLSRQHDNIGLRTQAYRKVAASAQAEVEMILAVRALDQAHGDLADLAEAKQRIAALERRAQALEVTASQKDAEIRRLTAAPAAAIHSGDD